MEETTKNVTDRIPLNLQLFAESTGEATPEPQGTEPAAEPAPEPQGTESTPTVEELMAQLAAEKAENQKLQNKYNKASTEAAESKKALRAKQTAEEREAEEKAEAQRLADEEKEAMRKELNHIKAVAAYKSISDEKQVETLIEAISESDHASIALIIEEIKTKAVKEAKSEWKKTIQQPQFGTGEYASMSKKEIMAIEDTAERQKAILANRQMFGI